MSMLWVHEGYQKEFTRKVDAYISEVTEIKTQYSKAYGHVSGYAGDSSVNTANIYLQKRQKDLQRAIDSADNLKRKAVAYVSNAVSVDRLVSESIHKQSYSFYKSKGIGPQNDNILARGWNSIRTTASDFCHDVCGITQKIIADIKEFYEDYKYVFNIAFDILAVSAALALFAMSGGTLLGMVCAIGAAWATAKATYELATDCLAVEAWINGDIGRAEDLSSRTLTGDFIKASEWIDGKIGIGLFEPLIKSIISGLEVCQFVVKMMFVWDEFRDIFNLKVRSDGKPLKIFDHRVKLTQSQRKLGWQMFKASGTKGMGLRFANPTNWIKLTAWDLGLSFKSDAKTFAEFTGSLLDNSKKNSERIKEITVNPSNTVKAIPGISESLSLWNQCSEIFAM